MSPCIAVSKEFDSIGQTSPVRLPPMRAPCIAPATAIKQSRRSKVNGDADLIRSRGPESRQVLRYHNGRGNEQRDRDVKTGSQTRTDLSCILHRAIVSQHRDADSLNAVAPLGYSLNDVFQRVRRPGDPDEALV